MLTAEADSEHVASSVLLMLQVSHRAYRSQGRNFTSCILKTFNNVTRIFLEVISSLLNAQAAAVRTGKANIIASSIWVLLLHVIFRA